MSSELGRRIQRLIDRVRGKARPVLSPPAIGADGREIPAAFAREYDLDALQLVTPRGHDFQMYITPRYSAHYHERSYEPFTADPLCSVLRGSGLFVDIGAHYGFFSLLASAHNPALDIIAIEPTPVTCEVLTPNVARFAGARIAVHQVAISDRSGREKFNVSLASDNCGAHLIAPSR